MEKRALVLLEFFKQLSLIKRIVIGIVVGAVLGIFLPQWSFIAILGSLFVGALKGLHRY
jgi:serine/threonine transporter